MVNNRDHIWSIPLVGAVLTAIGLFTPAFIFSGTFFWFIGSFYVDADPFSNFFYWSLTPFLEFLFPLILLLGLIVIAIVLAIMTRIKGEFKGLERYWFILGGLFFVPSIYNLIWALVTFGDFFYLFKPGFAFIAPMISGFIIILGTILNKYVLINRSVKTETVKKIARFYRNILFTLAIGGIIFLFGSIISYSLIYLLPGDPAYLVLVAMGNPSPSPAEVLAMEQALGLHLHPILQYVMFLCQTFTGNLGISVSIVSGGPVAGLLAVTIPRMIEVLALPILIVITLSIVFIRFLSIKKSRWFHKLMQVPSIIFLSFPIFFIGMAFQLSFGYVLGIIPATGYKTMSYTDPTFRTGFLILDSILDGQLFLAIDIFNHLITPMLILGVVTFAFILLQSRAHIVNRKHQKSLLRYSVIIGSIFGFIIMFYVVLDNTFGLAGFGRLLMDSIFLMDYYVLIRSVFSLVVIFVIILVISVFAFILYKFIRSMIAKAQLETEIAEKVKEDSISNEEPSREPVMKFIIRKLKSLELPLGIVGIAFLVFFLLIAIIPQLITSYTIQEIMVPSAGSWNPPSPDHPFGQTILGMDVLSLVVYGIGNAFIFGIIAVLIGLAGGIPLGYLAGRFRKWAYKPIMAFMLIFYILPIFLILFLLLGIFGQIFSLSILLTGILLIPNFTRAISNVITDDFKQDLLRIGKKLLGQIPLNFAIAIIIDSTLGFLGISYGGVPHLGIMINYARSHIADAPWAFFWPSLALFGIVFGFLLLYLAFQDCGNPLSEFKLQLWSFKRTKSVELIKE
ncbi:MAG: ABC transporter permease subunit [Promethearchaeota archaeon]